MYVICEQIILVKIKSVAIRVNLKIESNGLKWLGTSVMGIYLEGGIY